MTSLIVVGKRKRREHALERAVTVIGRDAGVDLDLGDLQVSRRHALVVKAHQGTFLKDLGSRNGVLVNQQRVGLRQQVLLRNGDVLQLGRTTLIFKDVAVTPPGEPPAPTAATVVAQAIARPAEAATPPVVPPPAPASPPTPPTPRSESHSAIPRAFPAPVYSGPAEVLALRALLERAERERRVHRAIITALVGALGVTVLIAAAVGLGRSGPEPSDLQSAAAAAEPTAEETEPPTPALADELDRERFAREVQPVLASACAGCHERVGRGGRLLLASGADPETVAANYDAVRAFVTPGAPERSPLLLAPLAPAEGGTGHGGGAVLAAASPEWRALQAWVAGPRDEAAAAAPSAAIDAPAEGRVGEAVALSGAASASPSGAALTFRWTLLERPAGSQAALEAKGGAEARLLPDLPGRYAVALIVHDGRAPGSAQHAIEVDVARAPGAWRAAAEALLGRPLTEDEGRALAEADPARRAELLLEREELYARWWAAELEHLGLTGRHRPEGEPWSSLPRRLQAGHVGVEDVLFAVLVGQDWASRHAGRDAYVAAALERLLGPERSADPALVEAARKLFDGHPAELLGQPLEDQVGLVRALVQSPEAHRAALARALSRVLGRPVEARRLERAAARLEREPERFFAVLVETALGG